jgi:hypothetical protein
VQVIDAAGNVMAGFLVRLLFPSFRDRDSKCHNRCALNQSEPSPLSKNFANALESLSQRHMAIYGTLPTSCDPTALHSATSCPMLNIDPTKA